jgi:hypothetical protein
MAEILLKIIASSLKKSPVAHLLATDREISPLARKQR